MTETPLKVGIYGIGHFGYAVLRLLEGKAGSSIELRGYDRDPKLRSSLRHQRCHLLFPAPQPLAEAIEIVDSVGELMEGLDVLILAVTSKSTREVIAGIAEIPWSNSLHIINTAKALDYATGQRLSTLVAQLLKDSDRTWSYTTLAGGTIASDLLLQHPLGITIASESEAALQISRDLFTSSNLWIQTTRDLLGVELAGAFKNVIAISAGMMRGLGLSYGSETHLISRMAEEVATFCIEQLGAEAKTFSIGSQCWGSDLWMSCTGPTRNRELGELLGEGKSLEEANAIMAERNKTVEGVQTLKALTPLLEQYPHELRLIRAADDVIRSTKSPEHLVTELMRDD